MNATARQDVRKLFANIVDLWEERRPGPGLLPSRANFEMADFKPWLGWVSIYDIKYGDAIRFKIRLAGTQVTHIERANNTGRYLDEVFPPDKYPGVFEPYFEALAEKQPVYLQRTVPTLMGYPQVLSKLVLPVAADGRRPDKFINILHYSDTLDHEELAEPLII